MLFFKPKLFLKNVHNKFDTSAHLLVVMKPSLPLPNGVHCFRVDLVGWFIYGWCCVGIAFVKKLLDYLQWWWWQKHRHGVAAVSYEYCLHSVWCPFKYHLWAMYTLCNLNAFQHTARVSCLGSLVWGKSVGNKSTDLATSTVLLSAFQC